jgi:hypothetical protein
MERKLSEMEVELKVKYWYDPTGLNTKIRNDPTEIKL